MEPRSCLAIVLAAGEGTRMRSARPKVLHTIAGRSLLDHVLSAVAEADTSSAAIVVGPGQDAVAAEAKRVLPGASCFVQHERKGTAHAVLAAKSAIAQHPDDIIIVYGDTPLIRPETLTRLPPTTCVRGPSSALTLAVVCCDVTSTISTRPASVGKVVVLARKGVENRM